MLRASMSIPANIVEGRSQKSERDFARFLSYALNSSSELEYHFIVARDLKVISGSDFKSLFDQNVEVQKMLHALLKRIEESKAGHNPPGDVPTPAASG
jgi:four helix bundle protein